MTPSWKIYAAQGSREDCTSSRVSTSALLVQEPEVDELVETALELPFSDKVSPETSRIASMCASRDKIPAEVDKSRFLPQGHISSEV